MIDDSELWHNINEKLGVIGWVVLVVAAVIAFIWNWIFIKTFAKHSDVDKKIARCLDKVNEGDNAAHSRIEADVKSIGTELRDLKDWLMKTWKGGG